MWPGSHTLRYVTATTGRFPDAFQAKPGVSALTAVSVPVPVPAMAVKAGGGGDLHLQLLALGGVGRHGVAVVRPQAALALSPHRLRPLIGCVRAGAPAARACELRRDTRVRLNGRVAMATDGKGTPVSAQPRVWRSFTCGKFAKFQTFIALISACSDHVLGSISPQRTGQRLPNTKPPHPSLKPNYCLVMR